MSKAFITNIRAASEGPPALLKAPGLKAEGPQGQPGSSGWWHPRGAATTQKVTRKPHHHQGSPGHTPGTSPSELGMQSTNRTSIPEGYYPSTPLACSHCKAFLLPGTPFPYRQSSIPCGALNNIEKGVHFFFPPVFPTIGPHPRATINILSI